ITDISLDPNYAEICGYSQQEFETGFAAHIESVAKRMNITKEKLLEQVKHWYDGYSWDGKTFMYNPFSALNFLSQADFVNFWFNTGTPTMLLNIIKKKRAPEDIVSKDFVTNRSYLESGYLPATPDEMLLFFQTGYLTVKSIDEIGFYKLDFPNTEVRAAFFQSLLAYYDIRSNQETIEIKYRIERNIRDNNPELLSNAIKKLFDVPYPIKGGKEDNYHAFLHVALNALGFDIQSEIPTEDGRIDAVWHLKNLTVIIEIKQHKTKRAETLIKDAMQQIHTKKYYEKYLGEIILLAVAFSGSNVECKMEKITR
ncbi:MAG: ATP-binding protein, partial [Bacteroidales bacterium]|nr:ATP-binding protein [Bacteroidales bacterium]